MKDSSFEDDLRDSLAERRPEDPGPHLSSMTLTELLEGTLGEEERTGAEAHLAECAACREWAVEAAGALEDSSKETPVETPSGAAAGAPKNHQRQAPQEAGTAMSPAGSVGASVESAAGAGQESREPGTVVSLPSTARPQPGRKAGPKRWGWAAAAVLVLAATLWQWQEHRSGPAKPEAQVEAWVAQAREAELPELDLFPGLATPGAEAQLRRGTLFDRPLQIAPRWSRILGRRPTFVFATQGEDHEILLVDGAETLVASIPFQETQPVGTLLTIGTVPLPDSLADLTPGGRYAWKVNSRIDGELVASPYVPFEVLTEDESAALARHLEVAGDDLFRRGAVFAAAGLLGEASRAFGRWSERSPGMAGEEGEELQNQIMEELLRRQKLPAELARAGEGFLLWPEE